jgi:hypothetical protein
MNLHLWAKGSRLGGRVENRCRGDGPRGRWACDGRRTRSLPRVSIRLDPLWERGSPPFPRGGGRAGDGGFEARTHRANKRLSEMCAERSHEWGRRADPPSSHAGAERASVMPFAASIDDLFLADAETDPHSMPPAAAPPWRWARKKQRRIRPRPTRRGIADRRAYAPVRRAPRGPRGASTPTGLTTASNDPSDERVRASHRDRAR